MSGRSRASLAVATALCLSATPSPGSDRHPAETAVFEAVLRQQIADVLDATARAEGTIVCLGINPGEAPQSPNREFMSRFKRETAVRRLTECDPNPKRAFEGVSRRPAVIVTAGPIEWMAEDEAWVAVTLFRSRLESAVRTYRVVREPSGWVSLGPISRGLPVLEPPNR